MIVTEKNLKSEIKKRISLIELELNNIENKDILYLILSNEHSQYSEYLNLINIFENRIGFEDFNISKYTPILDYYTKEPLKIGDKVKNNQKQCGTLNFDDYSNRYFIKTEMGGKIYSSVFIKINELYDYKIDTTKVECRPNPNKKNGK